MTDYLGRIICFYNGVLFAATNYISAYLIRNESYSIFVKGYFFAANQTRIPNNPGM